MAQILINPEFVLIIISSFTIILLIIIAFCLIKKKKLACSNGSLEKLIKNDDHQKGEFAAPKSRSYYDQFLSKDEVDHFKVSIKWLDSNLVPKLLEIFKNYKSVIAILLNVKNDVHRSILRE